MTNAHEESRTLVKSPPELWAELSDVTSLSRHLHEFGEIRITRLEPETAVAWEGERASGTVRLEPSGWGTKVILTAQSLVVTPDPPVSEAPEPAPPPQPSPEPAPPPQPAPPPSPAPMPPAPTRAPRPSRSGLFGRLFGFRSPQRPDEPPAPARAPQPPEPKPEPRPEATPEPAAATPPAPEPTAPPSEQPGFDAAAILASALDSLGQAHHRPFSRA